MHKKYKGYTFIRQVRRTSVSDVNLVRDTSTGAYLALTSLCIQPEDQKVMLSKMQLLKNARHQNVQKTLEVIITNNGNQTFKEFIIVSEYIDDHSLQDILDQLNQYEKYIIMIDLCEGIKYLQNQLGVVHRGLRSKTIIIKNRRIILSDLIQIEELNSKQKAQGLIGKKQYMSPQMLTCPNYDKKHDVWSLGIIFIQIVLGKSILQIKQIIPGIHPNFPQNILFLINDPLMKQLLLSMLQKDPQTRININKVLEQLTKIFQKQLTWKTVDIQGYLQVKQLNIHKKVNIIHGQVYLVRKKQSRQLYIVSKFRKITIMNKFNQYRSNLLKLSQNCEQIINIYEVWQKKANAQYDQVIVICEYFQKGSLRNKKILQQLQDYQIFDFLKDMWYAFRKMYQISKYQNQEKQNIQEQYCDVFDHRLITLDNFWINAGRIKLVPFWISQKNSQQEQQTNVQKQNLFNQQKKKGIWKLGLVFLQLALKKIFTQNQIIKIKKQGLKVFLENQSLKIGQQMYKNKKIYPQLQPLLHKMLTIIQDDRPTLQQIEDYFEKNILTSPILQISSQQQIIYKEQYKLQKQISRGAFGNVYLCKTINGQQYALKKIKLNKSQNKQQIILQGKICVSLNHVNIVKAKEYFLDKKQSQLIIIMEMCEEFTLKQLIQKIPKNQKIKVLLELCQAIRYLHIQQKIIHRDIKPTNILIKNGIIKLADLGRAAYLKTNEKLKKPVGSKYYMSPQMLNNKSYDMKTDIWSLGIVFLQVILGRKLNKGGIIGMDPDFPDNVLLEINDLQLRKHMKKMLQRKPQNRYNIEEVYNFLKECRL